VDFLKKEISRLEADLALFAKKYPDCVGKEAKGEVNWSDPSVIREYLHDARIALFYEATSLLDHSNCMSNCREILEFGSGTGFLLRILHDKYPEISLTGYDIYPQLLTLSKFLSPHATFHQKDLFTVLEEQFDLVICMETLEHLIDPNQAVRQILSTTKSSGSVFLTVPNGRLDSLPSYGLLPNQKGYWGHIHFWSPESWKLFLAPFQSHFQIETGELQNRRYLYALLRG